MRLSTGLTLRALVAEQDASSGPAGNMIQPNAILLTEDPKAYIQVLVRTDEAGKESKTRVRVEYKPYKTNRQNPAPKRYVIQKVEELAKLLSHTKASDAGFRTLRCLAVIPPAEKNRFAFAMELPGDSFPEDVVPLTLQQAIESKTETRPTLDEKFATATAIATSSRVAPTRRTRPRSATRAAGSTMTPAT